MKIGVLAALLVLIVATSASAPSARSASGAPSGSILTVSTTADAVNGDVSSPSALVARPGSDGISLREAITAANNASGREAITFAAALAGQTIRPTAYLPAFTHDGTALIGTTTPDNQPAVTLDASGSNAAGHPGFLNVFASDVSIEHLRIVGVSATYIGITVWTGAPGGEQHVHDVRLDSNVLDNGNAPGEGVALQIGTPTGHPQAANADLSDVTISRNVIRGFNGDGALVGLPGTGCKIENLLIENNTFANNTGPYDPAIEIVTSFSGNSVTSTRIVGNTFTGNAVALYMGGGIGGVNQSDGTPIPATSSTISGTLVSQNVFDSNFQAVAIVGGLGASSATGNAVVNTVVSNNVVARSTSSFAAIYIFGGIDGATGNRVDGLQLVNDTIAFNAGGIVVDAGGSGNQISNLSAKNSIFWMNGADIGGPDAAALSTARTSSLVGVDPQFVSRQDRHLQPGSPAIDTGASSAAPPFDLEGRARVGAPDIGAYEFGAASRPQLDVDLEELGGTGTVTSTPAGIACVRTCEAAFDANTTVTLTAAPTAASVFGGWSGPCSGTGACTLTLAAAATVTATFEAAPATAPPPPPLPTSPKVAVTVAVRGKGRVTGGGISCPARCKTTIASGTKLTLRASAASGYRFAGWTGACSGIRACILHPAAAVKTTATFRRSHS